MQKIKILYVNSPKYDFLTASLIQGLNSLPHQVEFFCSSLGNYATSAQVLSKWDAIDFGNTQADIIILGSNHYVDHDLFWSTGQHKKRVFVDGSDSGTIQLSWRKVQKLNAIFKRELFLKKNSLRNLAQCLMPGKIGLWGTQRSHPWVKFPAFHSLSNEPSFRTLGQGLFLSGTKVPVFPLPFAIEDRFKSDYNPDPKFILSCMLTPHLPERQEIVDFLKTQNLEHSFIGQIKARAADIEAIAKLGVSHPDLIKKGGTGLFHNTEYYRQIHESRACISVPGGGFDTLRFWEILGQGSLLISKRVALEMPNPLEEGKHYLAFDSLKELKAVIKRLYSRPEKLDSIRASGYQHAMRFHTASVRASWFLEKISNLK